MYNDTSVVHNRKITSAGNEKFIKHVFHEMRMNIQWKQSIK